MTTSDSLKLRLITSNDAKAVKNFVREYFFETEPIHQCLFRKECKDFRYFYKARSIGDCINEGLSYMYVTETGEIAALALIAYKFSSPSSEDITPIVQKLTPFFDIIDGKVKPITNLRETDKEACFRILAVHPDWIGKGLAKLLTEKGINSLKMLGFTHIKAYCTSAYSTKLFEKFCFKNLCSFKYADYTQNGEVGFLPDEPHTHLNFMHVKL